MQNKFFVTGFAVLLTLVCLLYLSFSFATNYYESEIEEAYAEDSIKGQELEDSLLHNKVYCKVWSLKECREMGIGLGLDLKGGMNVVLEVSVPDVVMALSNHRELSDEKFKAVMDAATEEAKKSQSDFLTLFIKKYQDPAIGRGEGHLAESFATPQLRGKVNSKSTDKEVEAVLRDEIKSAIDNSYNVLRSRIDRFGVAQPNIQTLEGKEGRIMVELPGVKEPERVLKLLSGSANLEFWETYYATEDDILNKLQQIDAALAAEVNGDAAPADTTLQAEADTLAKDSAKVEKGDLAAALGNEGTGKTDPKTAKEREKVLKQHPLLGRLQLANNGCVVGYAQRSAKKNGNELSNTEIIDSLLATPVAKEILGNTISLKWGVKGEGSGENMFALYAIKITERDGRAPMDGSVITDASDTYDHRGLPCVNMKMNTEGAKAWAALTKNNVKRCVAIVLDNQVYSAPVVQNEITGGSSEITGSFTVEETGDLANVLKSGKMPAPAQVVSYETVGPSLGAESIRWGVISCIVAFVILMVYMIVMYGFTPGMVANAALILNLFFTVGVLTSFQAALTMSGIAGMVLSLGMAVDANVLIYERTKEEMRAGKKVREALQAGYSNAFSAIFDSNLTSIITGVILFKFGTGPIQGFATTLIIGILVSFFTAVFLTRVVYFFMMERDKWLGLTFTSPIGKMISFQNPSFKFMRTYKASFIVFGVMALVSVIGIATLGFSKSIDFTGGRNYVVQLEQEVSLDDVRGYLGTSFPESNNSAIALGTDGKTLRIGTNFRIEEDGTNVDDDIESTLYTIFTEHNIIDKSKVSLEEFRNRDDIAREDGTVKAHITSNQKVGPTIAEDITRGAIISVLLAFVAIFIYILVRFRNLAFSVGAITALFFDIILILGAYALCWKWMPFSMEIDQTFIGAILTAIGYSINDKVVVFDRIREYIGLYPKRDRQDLFNSSLNSTLNRTINTSVSTFIVLAVIFCLGGASIRSFAFAMILGVVIGTFSSIFVAAPTAYLTMGKKIKTTDAPAEEQN